MKTIGVLAAVIGFGAASVMACGETSSHGGSAIGDGGSAGEGAGGSVGTGGSKSMGGRNGGTAGSAPIGGTRSSVGGTSAYGGEGEIGGTRSSGGTHTEGGAGEIGGSGPIGGTYSIGGEGGEGGVGGDSGFVSIPNLELVEDGATQASGFTLDSSNLTSRQSGNSDEYYKEWFGEVTNHTNKTQCLINVQADFRDASKSLIKLSGYASGNQYDLGLAIKLVAPCAAPGETVPVWTNALDKNNLDLKSLKQVVVHITGLDEANAKLDPATPKLLETSQTWNGTEWQFSGSAKSVADINAVDLEFWGKSGGLIVGRGDALHIENLVEGDTWNYTSDIGIKNQNLDSVASYFDFADGLNNAARIVYSGEAAEVAERRSAAQAEHQAAAARRDQAQ